MVTNPKTEYLLAQREYIYAKTLEERILALEKMIQLAPKHKGSENLLADLRGKLAKLKKQQIKEKQLKKKILSKPGIKRGCPGSSCRLD